MSAMTNRMETTILNVLRNITAVAPAKVYVALMLSDPTETGTAGTEASYTGYARQELVLNAPTTSGSDVSTANTSQITFPTPTGAAGTATHAAIFDAATGGNALIYKQLTNPIVLTSETAPRFAVGELELFLNGGDIDPVFKAKIINYLRGTSITGCNPYLALYTGDPASEGVELSGTGYARLALVFSEPVEQVSGQMQTANTNAAQSAAASSNWGTWAYGVIMDAQTVGNRLFKKANAGSYVMNNGAQAYIVAGAITAALN